MRSLFTVSVSALALLGTSAAMAQDIGFNDDQPFPTGFRAFPQDTCDPLLVGVLTGRGYTQADLDELYRRGYQQSVGTGCGLARRAIVPPVPTDIVDNFPVVNPLPLPGNEPLLLPDLDNDPVTASDSRFYLSLKGAYLFPGETDYTVVEADNANNVETFSDDASGFGGSAALGYRFSLDILSFLGEMRAELQGSYYTSDLENIQLAVSNEISDGNTGTPSTDEYDQLNNGSETSIAGFINLVKDIELGGNITPYIGGGVGYGQRTTTFDVTDSTSSATPVTFSQELSTTGLYYQGMVGAAYRFSDSISLELGYKYLQAPEHDAQAQNLAGSANTWSSSGRTMHMVEVGIQYRF